MNCETGEREKKSNMKNDTHKQLRANICNSCSLLYSNQNKLVCVENYLSGISNNINRIIAKCFCFYCSASNTLSLCCLFVCLLFESMQRFYYAYCRKCYRNRNFAPKLAQYKYHYCSIKWMNSTKMIFVISFHFNLMPIYHSVWRSANMLIIAIWNSEDTYNYKKNICENVDCAKQNWSWIKFAVRIQGFA